MGRRAPPARATLHQPAPPKPRVEAGIDAVVQTVVDSIVTCPAFVVNARLDVLAFNHLANIIYQFDAPVGRFAKNMVWRAFMDPTRQARYPGWEARVRISLGTLRANYASRVGDPDFEELIAALREGSLEFVRLWESQGAVPLDPIQVTLPPLTLGSLSVCVVPFSVRGRPGEMMVVLTPTDATTRAVFLKYSAKKRARRRPH